MTRIAQTAALLTCAAWLVSALWAPAAPVILAALDAFTAAH